MNNEKKIIPELRFPEFANNGEWQYLNGDELFEPISNRDHNSDLPILAISQDHGAIPREMIDYTVIASEESIKSYKVVEKGDFIISLRSFQGGIEYSNYKGICSPAYIILRKRKKLEDSFFKYYFKTDLYIRHLNKNLEGIRDGKMVSYKQFSEISLPYPSIKEQQKLVSFLFSLDDLIETQMQKLDTLKIHKKGLMQNLFPQEDKKIPNFRFPEYVNDGEWVGKKLGEMTLKVGSGVTPLGGESVYKKNGRPFVRSQNVGWGVFLLENIAFIDEETHQDSISTEIEIDDVLLNITGASIGRSAVANQQVNGGNVNQHVCIIRTHQNQLNSFFLCQYLISNFGQKQIDSFQAGGNRQGLNFAQIRSLSIPSPPSLQEQQKIASCLSALDILIKAQSDKIEQLKEYKKGLMQSLFPNNNF